MLGGFVSGGRSGAYGTTTQDIASWSARANRKVAIRTRYAMVRQKVGEGGGEVGNGEAHAAVLVIRNYTSCPEQAPHCGSDAVTQLPKLRLQARQGYQVRQGYNC